MLVLHRPLRLGPAGVDRTSVELSHLVVAISRNTLVSPLPFALFAYGQASGPSLEGTELA